MSPSGSISNPLQHTFHSPEFDSATVLDAMRLGVVTVPPETPLREVARVMATYRIHAVVVSEIEGDRPWGIVSDLDLVAAADKDFAKVGAQDILRSPLVTITPDEHLGRAAELMTKHRVTHLVVVQPHTGHPVGVLSTLDLAGVFAWGGDF